MITWLLLVSLFCKSTQDGNRQNNGNEISTTAGVYPRNRVFKVGSRVTFRCVLSAGQIFDKMYLTGYNDPDMKTEMISNQTYALTVHLNKPSNSTCTDVKCHIQHVDTTKYGTCAHIGYPPGDVDLKCETRDLESVECRWTARDTHLARKLTTYQLVGRSCVDGSKGRCSQKVQVDVGERNWTLTVQNELGKVELSDRADLTKRVHMFAPEGVTASTVNARSVSLKWVWTVQQYNNINITCQINVSHDGTNTMSKYFGVGLNFAVLTDLIPNWLYNVTVRCGTTQNFWNWGDWSTSVNFHTRGDVPDALDVWMQRKDGQIIITWKMLLANQSHGDITDYVVTWANTTETEQQNRRKVAHNKHHLSLSLDTTKEYTVTVTASNKIGRSSPSTMIVPRFSPDTSRVKTSLITGSSGGFSLSWSASPVASCGYIVDWCPTSGHCSVEWLKVPPNETNASVFSKNLKDGVRYSLSIYACTQGAPVLLERREGYVRQERMQNRLFDPLEWKQQESNVEVSWIPIPQTSRTAFIQGYILYWSDNNDNNNNGNVSTDLGNPEATSLTARNLKISSYTFTVKAQTAVGECGDTSLILTLDSLTDDLIKTLLISLVTVFSLLSLITVICYRHWACIKQTVYPPVPKPLLTEWLTSPGEHSCHPLPVDQCYYSEADIMDIPELHCKSGAPVNGYVSHKNIPFVFAQTPNGYYNQPLKKFTPEPLILPTTTIPSQSSSFRCVFPNLSYSLIMQTLDQQSKSAPDPLEGTDIERNWNGYQPQSHTIFSLNQTNEDSESPMSCVSTYILFPQSPST
ncbi:leukemia inhibitory factor receptor-like protein [Lates japonicus]|uniref:Leukemia inhibitory factor receptor-like protein n=1 Tax=Lates japonicus TaxID=270547 RepID=A0AAD3MDL6_LATJO|nr:leukemia inhibitory factor receptor-like protein [Lates japonicus]